MSAMPVPPGPAGADPWQVGALPLPPAALGESPFWHPQQRVLYWCDIPGRTLHRWSPADGQHRQWLFPCEPACAAPLLDGGLLLGMRDGLWRFDPESGERSCLAEPPYDPASTRFNDGKADPLGRLWAGTMFEPRDEAAGKLYRYDAQGLAEVAGGSTISNGLAFAPDGRTLYWADTTSAQVWAFDLDLAEGTLSRQRLFARFPLRQPGQPLASYGGRPDGAAVDSEGCYWVAMFEGARLLRFAPDGRLLRQVDLPVRCPTMPCFGDDDLRTLYVTTARIGRGDDELAAMPDSGRVLRLRVDVPGLPVNFAQAWG